MISQKIKNMSFVCAILVVAVHVHWINDSMGIGWWMYHLFAKGISCIAVPFFFLVSGYFLARHFNDGQWWQCELRKRVFSLAIPFVIWSIIGILANVLPSLIANLMGSRPLCSNIYMPSSVLQLMSIDLCEYPMKAPLWYVRCLFLFVVTGALFKYSVAKLKFFWLLCVFVLVLLVGHIPNQSLRQFLTVGYSALGMFYFSCGVFIQNFVIKDVKSHKPAIICGTIGLALLFAKVFVVYNSWRCGSLICQLSLPFLIYFTWHFMSCKSWPIWLTSCSFPIYLIHTIFIGWIAITLKHFPVNAQVGQFLLFVGAIFASIIASLLLRRMVPVFAKVAFGGR